MTRSSWEGVHLKLQIKRRGLGPHGGALPENGLFMAEFGRARRIEKKTNENEVFGIPICNTRCYTCPSDVAMAHLTFQVTIFFAFFPLKSR